ncbi:hypothetical protein Ahy_B09g099298 isoform B [Arachis hypogaea]|uniref:Uncharacterized protein n=1 Tax=Arachis hypogaea TaxID=3818 RepID=A0A444XTD3_ARAHY|nr:hypothetical protein Ahy_B09g099298 isoform B [Arachis hypogaea]
MKMKKLLFSILLFAFTVSSFLLSLSLAKGALFNFASSSSSSDFDKCINTSHARHLLEDDVLRTQTSVDLAKGYMTNADLEKAIKQFGQRCSNISRIYR